MCGVVGEFPLSRSSRNGFPPTRDKTGRALVNIESGHAGFGSIKATLRTCVCTLWLRAEGSISPAQVLRAPLQSCFLQSQPQEFRSICCMVQRRFQPFLNSLNFFHKNNVSVCYLCDCHRFQIKSFQLFTLEKWHHVAIQDAVWTQIEFGFLPGLTTQEMCNLH